MALPFFYKEDIASGLNSVVMDEDTSKHIVQVLRMKNGEQLHLTDGKGKIFLCEIINDQRKKCEVTILKTSDIPYPTSNVCIAISPLKNNNRFEWFLEKATEIGVQQIIPVICERTEKTTFKSERLNNILVSAMLQSQQAWLPVLQAPIPFRKVIDDCDHQQKFIAHCAEDAKRALTDVNNPSLLSKIILVGPEGDFTDAEIEYASAQHFIAVALGNTRLRTETAGIVAATLLCNP